jgi:hypothetical protein
MRQSLKQGLLATVAGGVLAVAGGVGAAQASTLQQLISAYPSFFLEDDDAETIVDRNGNSPTLDVGDSLRGIAVFTNFQDLGTPQTIPLLSDVNPASPNTQVSTVFEIEVLSKTSVGGGLYNFTFGPNAAFAAGLGLPVGTMIAFYEDTVNDFAIDGCTTGAGGSCEANVTDGTLVFALGQLGDPDAVWKANNVPENTDLSNESPNVTVGNFQYALETTFSTIGTFQTALSPIVFPPPVGGDGKVDGWTGSGSVLGTFGVDTSYTATSDTDTGGTPLPEPATLGLLGFGLLGLGFAVSRRRRVA